jgi:hypothetical protein
MCFKAHVKHYQSKLLAEKQEESAEQNQEAEEAIDANAESGDDEDENLIQVNQNVSLISDSDSD